MNPTVHPNIAVPAGLIGEPTRAAILMALCDGRAHAAGALAGALGISAQSASNHLARLVDGGLLAAVRQGRHKYYRLASPEVAQTVEALAAIAAPLSVERLNRRAAGAPLLLARCCYRHLAGSLGVALLEALLRQGLLRACGASPSGRGLFEPTEAGRRWLESLGLEAGDAATPERFALACIDWTQRREHLAGRLGNALLAHFLRQDYLVSEPHGRALRLTPRGEQYFREAFAIDAQALVRQTDEASRREPAGRHHAARL